MKLSIVAIIFILGFGNTAKAEKECTLSGRVTDSNTGEYLIGATVLIYGQLDSAFISANEYGFYSITVSEGSFAIIVSLRNYCTTVDSIILNGDLKKDFNIETVSASCQNKFEIEIVDEKQLGEKNILETTQLLPVIDGISEESAGFMQRGRFLNQNMILLDGAPLYGSSHLTGFLPLFNPEVLKGVSMYKRGLPLKYKSTAYSTTSFNTKEGNNQNISVSKSFSIMPSRICAQGPLIKDKASFIFTNRQTLTDKVAKLTGLLDDDTELFFSDYVAKVNYKINDNNHIYLSGYLGKDVFNYEDVGQKWKNTTGSFRWNHVVNNKLFSNTSLIYSNYKYGFNLNNEAMLNSGIEDYGIKQDFTWYKNTNNTVDFGFCSIYHNFKSGDIEFNDHNQSITDQKQALESAVYLSSSQKLAPRILLNYGLRISAFSLLGEGVEYNYDNNGNIYDSATYTPGEHMQTYFEYEPQLSLNYRFSKTSSIKASYNRTSQYLHLLTNNTSGQPIDIWIPSSNNIKPLTADQYSLGYYQKWNDNKYEFSVEAYYKDLDNVSDFKSGTDLKLVERVKDNILQGVGRSYGADFYITKKHERFGGWICYSISKNETKINGINNNKWYNTSYNQTHVFSIAAKYRLNKRYSISANWVYNTGNLISFPNGTYHYNDEVLSFNDGLNQYKTSDYHRLDLNLHIENRTRIKRSKKNPYKKRHIYSCWDFTIYNAYNRNNTHAIIFNESNSVPGTNEASKISLFGIVPSVSYNIKF